MSRHSAAHRRLVNDLCAYVGPWFPHAEARALFGINDKGDITGIPGVVIEAKTGAFNPGDEMDQARREAANAGASLYFVVHRRRNCGIERAYLLTEVGAFPWEALR